MNTFLVMMQGGVRRARAPRRHSVGLGLAVLLGVATSILGFVLLERSSEYKSRNVQHLASAIELRKTLERAPALGKATLIRHARDALEVSRIQSSWCVSLAEAEWAFVRAAGAIGVRPLCMESLALSEIGLHALARFEQGSLKEQRLLARLQWIEEEETRLSLAIQSHTAQVSRFARQVVIASGAISGVALLVLFLLLKHARRRATERVQAEQTETGKAQARLAAAFDAAGDGFAIFDRDRRLLACNTAYRDLWSTWRGRVAPGMSAEEVMRISVEGGLIADVAPEDYDDHITDTLKAVRNERSYRIQLVGDRHIRVERRATGNGDTVLTCIDETGLVRARRADATHAAELRDMNADLQARSRELAETATSLREAQAELERSAHHDALTGLPNRRLFDRELMRRDAAPGRQGVTLLRIDLDHFKYVNDTLGHAAGDMVLRHVGSLLVDEAPDGSCAARLGGDEFVVLLPAGSAPSNATGLFHRLRERLAVPPRFEGRPCRFGISGGVASTDLVAGSTEDLLTHADAALYQAKANGRMRCELYTVVHHTAVIHERRISDEIHDALDRAEFLPVFQPQIDAATGRICGAEVLCRWQHPQRGLLPPAAFLPTAHAMQSVDDIDRAILARTRDALDRWSASGLVLPQISFNVTASRVRSCDLLDSIRGLAGRGTRVAVELLESVLVEEETDDFLYRIDALKEAGIRVEIDDFGSGHASIVGLMKLRAHAIKIDRRITIPATRSPDARQLATSIVRIGHTLGATVTAEGVETEDHARLLRDIGCQTLQGYLFARPLMEDAFTEFARTWVTGATWPAQPVSAQQ